MIHSKTFSSIALRYITHSIGNHPAIRNRAIPLCTGFSKGSLGVVVVVILLAFCFSVPSLSAAQSEPGTLEIRIKDHRDAIGDFANLTITIDKILVSPNPGLKIWRKGWQELSPAGGAIDLTQYVDKTSAQVFRENIESGSFDAFHLKLRTIAGKLKKNQKSAPVKNAIGPVKLAFNVPPRGETVLIIDLTVTDMSDHPPRGYELEIQGYELFTNGKLVQKIPPG